MVNEYVAGGGPASYAALQDTGFSHGSGRLAANLEGREVGCGELGAVLGAHVGPGMLAVCVAPLLTPA